MRTARPKSVTVGSDHVASRALMLDTRSRKVLCEPTQFIKGAFMSTGVKDEDTGSFLPLVEDVVIV